MIQPLNMVPSENIEPSSSSQPPSTNQTEDTSVLDNLVSHYSGELPNVEPTLEKASEAASEAVASEKVASESPQQQTHNPQMTTQISSEHITSSKHVFASEHVSVSEPVVPEQLAPEQIQSSTIPLPKTFFKPTCIDNRVTIATCMDIE
jgi:hypothetical protein